MVSYYNPMAMYRQQGPVGPSSTQFHNSGSPSGAWYGGYHPGQMQVPTPQQYLSCMQDSEPQNMTWHHPHPAHSVFNHEFFEYNSYIQQQHGGQPLQTRPGSEPPLPSPPMSSSELSSPGAIGGGSVTPPNHPPRPGPVRSPYDWMTKPSYQSQPNPGKTRTKDKYRVVYTDQQRLELEKEFHFSRYITIRRKAELAGNLGLSERQVKIWFQNRRAKERKQAKKRDELTNKDPLATVNVTVALNLHQQTLLHHHQSQQQAHQQNQQALSAAVNAAIAHQHHHQTPLGNGGHVPVVPSLM